MSQLLIREFRLSPHGRGISCDVNGAFIGSVPMLKRVRANGRESWTPRDTAELSRELTARFDLPFDTSSKSAGLRATARALNENDVVRAQLVTLHLQLPDPPALAKGSSSHDQLIKFIRELHWSGLLKVWDPDKHPRWPAGAADSQGGEFAPKDADPDLVASFESTNTHSEDDIETAANTPRQNPATSRRTWERAEGKDWPRDPVTGRNHDAAHIRALADGGTNDPSNIKPMPHDEHVQQYKDNGDFGRWAQRKGSKNSGGLAQSPRPARASPVKPAPESAPTPEDVDPMMEDLPIDDVPIIVPE